MLINNSKLMPGIGLDSTDKYSSLNKLLIAPFSDKSAHLVVIPFSIVRLFIKYEGSFPVNEISLDDIVCRLL